MAYTTALYLRLSVDDDNYGESESIANQRDLLRSYAAADPVISAGDVLEFSDDGWSGTTFDRPQVKKLLDAVRRGEVQCVLVKDTSRFGRNYIEVCDYVEQIFPFFGVRFVSVNDRYDSSDSGQGGVSAELMFNSLINDVYCRDLSFKVRQSYITKAKKGEFLCGEAPFGFVKSKTEKNKLEIDWEAALTVQRIFDMACNGMGTTKIAAALNGEKIDTPAMYRKRKGRTPRGKRGELCGGGMWTDGTVRKILTDERYAGVQVSGKTRKEKPGSRRAVSVPEDQWIRVPGAHEPIVTEEVFARAGAAVGHFKTTGVPTGRHAPFAGKIFCGRCGRALDYQPAQNSYYYCSGPRLGIDAGCFEGRAYVDGLNADILAAVKLEAQKMLDRREKSRERAKAAPSAKAAVMAELKQAEARMAWAEQRATSVYEAFVDGKLDRDGYFAARDSCAAERGAVETRIARLAEQLDSFTKAAEAPAEGPLLRRVLESEDVTGEVLSLIERIVVYEPARFEIRFAFGDTNLSRD